MWKKDTLVRIFIKWKPNTINWIWSDTYLVSGPFWLMIESLSTSFFILRPVISTWRIHPGAMTGYLEVCLNFATIIACPLLPNNWVSVHLRVFFLFWFFLLFFLVSEEWDNRPMKYGNKSGGIVKERFPDIRVLRWPWCCLRNKEKTMILY